MRFRASKAICECTWKRSPIYNLGLPRSAWETIWLVERGRIIALHVKRALKQIFLKREIYKFKVSTTTWSHNSKSFNPQIFLLRVRVVARTPDLIKISRRRLTDCGRETHLNECSTSSPITLPHSANHSIDLRRWRCCWGLSLLNPRSVTSRRPIKLC